jgi:hypothetical protein
LETQVQDEFDCLGLSAVGVWIEVIELSSSDRVFRALKMGFQFQGMVDIAGDFDMMVDIAVFNRE